MDKETKKIIKAFKVTLGIAGIELSEEDTETLVMNLGFRIAEERGIILIKK